MDQRDNCGCFECKELSFKKTPWCKLVQPLWRTVWRYLRKLYIELPYDPAIPLLGIYPDKTFLKKKTAPVRSLQLYSQWPRHGSNLNVHHQTHGWRRWVHIYNGIFFCHKKNEIMLFAATWMNVERTILSSFSQIEIDK